MIRQTRYILWAIGCLFALGAQAQEANFRQAERLLGSRVENILKSTRVTPNTIQESSSFWYKYETGDGIRYYYVNPRRGIRQEMFDRVAIAGEITKLTHEPVDHQQLDLKSVRFEEDERHFTFKVDTFVVRCALDSNRQIGGLLDFDQVASFADGVGVSSLHVNNHSRLDLDAVHTVKHSRNVLRLEKLLPALTRDPFFEAVIYAGARSHVIAAIVQEVPALSLSVRGAKQLFRTGGIGMDLNGKALPRIDELYQDAQSPTLRCST